ncbi:hypothetical protein ACIQUY_22065 [Streptomyces sp. NPDC090231]|uniref:hypothetical protein n=1 Tax=unclassified Streptomyces TaxID=2593676 RepID=UPI003826CA07
MTSDHASFEEILENPKDHPQEAFLRARAEKVLAISATLLFERGHQDIAALLAQADDFTLDFQEEDWGKAWYGMILDFKGPLLDRFTEEVSERTLAVAQEVAEREAYGINSIRARSVLPEVSANWRQLASAAGGARPSNHARKVRVGPAHPQADGLHFTNEWEWRVYDMLRSRQQTLPDNDTLGIVPLGAMKVRDHVFEPDLLITYRGYAGVIEIDGPHHKGRSSDDKSRERLLRNAGVKYIDRIDVRDTSTKEEVDKFVTDFLRHLSG